MKKQFILKAIEEANRSDQNFKHGAILVKNKKVVATGHNHVTKKCPAHMHSVHAEMAAIKQSKEKSSVINNSHIYVVRVNSCGLADSKPCCLCQQFMKMHGVSRVFYSTGKGQDDFASLYI